MTVLQAVVDGCVVVGTDPAFWFTITLRQERQVKDQIICNGREHMSGNTQKLGATLYRLKVFLSLAADI